jgi:glycosyltransferase involved in cell wall biosynthesis
MGVTGHDIADHGMGINPLGELRILLSIIRVIHKVKPDLIHAITIRHALYAGIAARLTGRKPAVFTLAGLGSLFSERSLAMHLALPLFRLAFRHNAAHVIFQNPDDRDVMENAGAVYPGHAALIRSSGVDLKDFAFSPMPQSPVPVVLFSSRLIREKGIEDFVEAARILKGKARFLVAGDVYSKNPKSLTCEEIQAWHDEGVIEWLGHVTDMPLLLKSSTIFVLPSYYREGVPKVNIEAMATGRPVITCDTPGCRETVRDGVNGLLVPPRDPQALARAIETLLAAPAQMAEMGKAGRAMAERDFSVESVVSRTLEVYDRAFKKV